MTTIRELTIHHIELSHTSPNLSGGEKALIELVKFLSKKKHIRQIIYTSESGAELFSRLIGTHTDEIKFVLIGSKKLEAISNYFAYCLRIFQQFFYLKKFDIRRDNLIFGHDEFLPTLLHCYALKKLNRQARWINFFHMKSPSLTKGFEGEFTGKTRFPSYKMVRAVIEQGIFFRLTRHNIEKIINVNQFYFKFLAKQYHEKIYTLDKFGGERVYTIKKYAGIKVSDLMAGERTYELFFMGRFHATKGIFELIDILKKLKAWNENIKLAIVGGGDKKLEKEFFSRVHKEGLNKNIKYFGYISGDEKFHILSSSKIMIFPSYYESFGQVVLEAMKFGIPVVAYDLPTFHVFKKGMKKVKILDNQKMVEEIIKLLENKQYYEKTSKEAKSFASTFSWEKTGKEIYEIIKELYRSLELSRKMEFRLKQTNPVSGSADLLFKIRSRYLDEKLPETKRKKFIFTK